MSKEIELLKQERRDVGNIIDDRSMNNIPFGPYVKRYNELDKKIQQLEAL